MRRVVSSATAMGRDLQQDFLSCLQVFQVSKMRNGSFLPVSIGSSLSIHKVEELSDDC